MAVKQKHIAIITVWYPTPESQSGVFVKEQAEALARSGCKVTVMHFHYFSLRTWLKGLFAIAWPKQYRKGSLIKSINFFCIDIIPSSLFSSPQRRQKNVVIAWSAFYFRLYSFFNGLPDIIHHHGIQNYSYITRALSEFFFIPYIITEHSPSIKPDQPIPKFNSYDTDEELGQFVRNAGARIAVSAGLQALCEKLFGAPFKVIPNMVSQLFEETAFPAVSKSTAYFQFLNIGHLIPRKRQKLLIEAFALAFSGDPKVRLYIVGAGRMRQDLIEAIDKFNLKESVRLLGNLSRKELICVMDESNVLVISSNAESFGMVAIEGMSRGLPVVSTICGGPEELINETNGLLCNRNDIAGMASAMRNMYVNYRRYNEKEIRNNVLNNYSEEVVINRLLDVYERVINDK